MSEDAVKAEGYVGAFAAILTAIGIILSWRFLNK